MTRIFQRKCSKRYANIWVGLGAFVIFLASFSGFATPVQWVELPNAGIDSDYDGVRDDVAAEIRKRYRLIKDRRWPMEIARAGQRHVTSDGNPFAIYRAQAEMQRALLCLIQSNDEKTADNVRDEVLGLVLNTDSRKLAYSNSIAQWESDVRHRNLPSRPDDRWQEGCGKNPALSNVVVRTKQEASEPAVQELQKTDLTIEPEIKKLDNLPAPNFFLIKEESEKKTPASIQTGNHQNPRETQNPIAPLAQPSLPSAFRVKEINQVNQLAASFRVGARQAESKTEEQAWQSTPVNKTLTENGSQKPLKETVSSPVSVSSVKTSVGDKKVKAKVLWLNPVSTRRDSVVDLQLDADGQKLPEADAPTSFEPSTSIKRAKTEVVVVVKKGKQQETGTETVTPLFVPESGLAEQDKQPVLPPALLDLAPFIKNFEYQESRN